MNWRLMWKDYCDFVTELVPIALGTATAAIVWFAVVVSALVIVRCWRGW